MTDFVSEVRDSRVSEALRSAVVGRQPFRRFKDALSNFPKERERWFQYEGLRRRDCIQEWAREAGVELDFNADAS